MSATDTMTVEPVGTHELNGDQRSEPEPTALTSIVPNVLERPGVVQDRTRDRRPSERAERHDRECHTGAHADLRDLAHSDHRLRHDRDEDARGYASGSSRVSKYTS